MKLLILHDTNNGTELISKIYSKYHFLTAHKDMYKVKVHKLQNKIPKTRYNIIYLDANSIDTKDERVLEYLKASPEATIIWVDVNKKKKSKMYTRTIVPIKRMKRKE